MAKPPPVQHIPPPGPEAGERVLYYFISPGATRLRSRYAEIAKLWTTDRVYAELVVDVTDEESEAWKIAKTQRSAPMSERPVCGSWVRLPLANRRG